MINCKFMSPGLNTDVVGGINTACCLMSQIISVPQIFLLYTSSCYICLCICLYVYFGN